MHKNRLEAFSDGVFAILITIMVLELKIPHTANLSGLSSLSSIFLSYVLSYIYIGIYWNNHHHLFQITKCVSGSILWANMHLLFWISMLPFVTAWSGVNNFASFPVAMYGFVLFMAGAAYHILTRTLISFHGKNAEISKAIGKDTKGKISVILYAIAIPIAFYKPYIAMFFYILVAAMWIIPDRRVEKVLNDESPE